MRQGPQGSGRASLNYLSGLWGIGDGFVVWPWPWGKRAGDSGPEYGGPVEEGGAFGISWFACENSWQSWSCPLAPGIRLPWEGRGSTCRKYS